MKEHYIVFHNGFWVVEFKSKSISRHNDIKEAIKARNKYIKEHPEMKLAFKIDLTEED